MTDRRDPQLVRDIARKAVRHAATVHGASFVGATIGDHDVMSEILASGDRTAYSTLCDAARAEVPAVLAELWPDNPQDAERDADVRAVARVLDLYAAVPYQGLHEMDLASACVSLQNRFADRIAALDEADAAAGGCRPNGDPIWEEQ